MIIDAIKVRFLEDVVVELTFQDGKIVRYDMSKMFSKYPQLEELRRNRKLFENGYLDPGGYAIIWNDDLDFSAMSIYECGELVGYAETTINQQIGVLLTKTREELKITQIELSRLSHIDQGDISKIERGLGNPTISKINKLFKAMGKDIKVSL
ncbi:MAG: DUF2442 domain-containing protein [Bacilli bacterium]|nr:DUF2442 domain-containing protein [Bacilli bacterium]